MIRKVLFLLFVLLSFVLQLEDQVTTSGITGKVTVDNEPVVGVAIQAIHEPSNTSYRTTTNSEGLFSLSGLRTGGPYKIRVSFIGSETVVLSDVFLQLGVTYQVNLNLKASETALNEVKTEARRTKFLLKKWVLLQTSVIRN